MDMLTIGDVARHTSLRTSAIPYYERLGLIPEPLRVSGQRRYGPDVFTHLATIFRSDRTRSPTSTEHYPIHE